MCTLLEYNKIQVEIMQEIGVSNYFKKIKFQKCQLSPAEIIGKFRNVNNFIFHISLLKQIIRKNLKN